MGSIAGRHFAPAAVVIFAGSGSGTTVLIRRLVEECARLGVSAIDPDPDPDNDNDLAHLGDPWPEPPSGWVTGDDTRARDYLSNTDVVIWTPLVNAGRPLSFQPLPELRAGARLTGRPEVRRPLPANGAGCVTSGRPVRHIQVGERAMRSPTFPAWRPWCSAAGRGWNHGHRHKRVVGAAGAELTVAAVTPGPWRP